MLKRLILSIRLILNSKEVMEGHARDIEELRSQVHELSAVMEALAEEVTRQREEIASMSRGYELFAAAELVDCSPPDGYERYLN